MWSIPRPFKSGQADLEYLQRTNPNIKKKTLRRGQMKWEDVVNQLSCGRQSAVLCASLFCFNQRLELSSSYAKKDGNGGQHQITVWGKASNLPEALLMNCPISVRLHFQTKKDKDEPCGSCAVRPVPFFFFFPATDQVDLTVAVNLQIIITLYLSL